MSFEYVRKYYGVPAKRGGRVKWQTAIGTRVGTLTRATCYVYVRFDDAPRRAVPLHPCEPGLQYCEEDG